MSLLNMLVRSSPSPIVPLVFDRDRIIYSASESCTVPSSTSQWHDPNTTPTLPNCRCSLRWVTTRRISYYTRIMLSSMPNPERQRSPGWPSSILPTPFPLPGRERSLPSGNTGHTVPSVSLEQTEKNVEQGLIVQFLGPMAPVSFALSVKPAC